MESGRHLRSLGDPGEVGLGPRTAEAERLRRSSVEIAHVRRKRLVAPIESAGQSSAEDAEVFLRRINLHGRVDLQEMIQAARMVAVAMGNDSEIQLPWIDPLGRDIMREDFLIVAGIEQDPLAAVLYESGKSPVLLQRRGLAERVV